MGCGNCGSGASGKPGGCKGNGGCSTGGCNRMNVFDWLSALPLYDSAKPYPIIEVSFSKGSRKDFFKNNTNHILEKGQWIAVEGISGYDIGQVSLTGELVKLQLKKYGIEDQNALKRVLHPATEDELKSYEKNKLREPEVLLQSRAMARNHKLEMKLAEVEIQADGKKGTFFYTADQRVDFRELIKVYASEFKLKVEMRQIGARQESGKVGGIGSCGRELCCSTWLSDFKSVNTTAARYQNLSINQTKLSGQCGRLKCCLNYELDTYMDALRVFPDNAEQIETVKGRATLQKRDIFKNLMWYSYSDSNKQYPMTIVRVKEILKLNKEGIKPEELQPVELETGTKAGVKVDVGFVNDVGQITLRSLEKGGKNKKKSGGGNGKQQQQAAPGQQPNRQQGNRQQGPRPAQGATATPQPRQRPEQQGQRQRPPQGGNQQAPREAQPAGGQQGQKPRQQQGPRPERGPQQPRPERGPQQPRPERPQRPNNNQNRNRERPKPPDTKPAE
ncbi:MAG: hypothetical protein JSS96_00810 [Bacteroidetes bacterium]|nr:hypothetical protein [Bacteroidota bacterium]